MIVTRTWPLAVGAVLYFIYALAFMSVVLYAILAGDPRVSRAGAIFGIFISGVFVVLGFGMFKAKLGNTAWLPWVSGTAASLAGLVLFAAGWVGAVAILAPILFGALGLSKAKNGG